MRWLAVVPMFSLAFAAYDYLTAGTPGAMLWICNVCNVVLALGLALQQPSLVWVATAWLVIGTPLWLLDDIYSGSFTPHALFTHVGGIAVGALAIRAWPAVTGTWWKGTLLLIAVGWASRWWTSPTENVNAAHAIYAPQLAYTDNFALYTVVNVALCAVALAALAWVFGRFAPAI